MFFTFLTNINEKKTEYPRYILRGPKYDISRLIYRKEEKNRLVEEDNDK